MEKDILSHGNLKGRIISKNQGFIPGLSPTTRAQLGKELLERLLFRNSSLLENGILFSHSGITVNNLHQALKTIPH